MATEEQVLRESNTDNGKDIGDPCRTYDIQNGSQTGTREISLTSFDDAVFTRGMID